MNQVKVTERVQKQLFELQDLQYRDFQAKLLPTIEKETVIGVRMPVLRKFAKGYGTSRGILPSSWHQDCFRHSLLHHGSSRILQGQNRRHGLVRRLCYRFDRPNSCYRQALYLHRLLRYTCPHPRTLCQCR